ncbi:uncharacterized protein LOC125194445 isoform X2 [Salvia hispanica]|uniref:uncharacterized protein LOC125194445 isoform X2 n=1 Tax=Salvia hispanica TaxID=49212 RepID=UPI00200983C1|nr:uncharacterized protein LOC125194445 isoform X2 [Salvia hispanica]
MGDFRSKSYKNEQLDSSYGYYGPNFGDSNANFKPNPNPSGMQDLRCYSASYASSSNGQLDIVVAGGGGGGGEQWKFKKGKSTNAADARSWTLTDPELQRKKRVASYKAYTVEGKVKGSFKKSFRWIKERNVTALPSWRCLCRLLVL